MNKLNQFNLMNLFLQVNLLPINASDICIKHLIKIVPIPMKPVSFKQMTSFEH